MISIIPPQITSHVLPLQVVLIGINHDQERVYRPTGMSFFQWFSCRKGVGEFIVGGKKHIIREGEGFLIYPNFPHEYESLTEHWHLDFIGFQGSLSHILLEQLGMTTSGAYHFYAQTPFEESLHDMVHFYEKEQDYSIGLSTRCYELLLKLPQLTEPLVEQSDSNFSHAIHVVIQYIEQHFQDDINLDDIAKACNYSKTHLCTLFKNEMKQTINEFLISYRISKARINLLQNPTKKVYQVAKECGYLDTSYFCKVFKNYEGKTPEEYRKNKILQEMF